MSKAFTKETDSDTDDPLPGRAGGALPARAVNYMTPDGVRRLRDEAGRLLEVERPEAAGSGDARRLAAVDRRIAAIEESLRTAVVVPPPDDAEGRGEVRLGAHVKARRGREVVEYRIVGADEVDLDKGWVSCHSPIARALMNARTGERRQFRFPSGEETLEVVEIAYDRP